MSEIHELFADRVTQLQALAGTVSEAYRGKSAGAWAIPATVTLAPMEPSSLNTPFDRTEINTDYKNILSGETQGNLGDVASLHRQLGFVAMEERAMRLRYASPARLAALTYGRLDGHSSSSGVFGKVQTTAQNFLKAGGVRPTEAGMATP